MSGRSTSSDSFGDILANIWSRLVDHFEQYEISKAEVIHKVTLALTLFFAFIVRLFPLLKGYDELIKAFDPYVQLSASKYLAEHGLIAYLKWHRFDSWYPWGIYQGYALYLGVPLSAYLLFKLFTLLGLSVTIQDVAYIQPAIFGTIGVLYSYFLAKETISRRAGLFAAIFLAVIPAFTSRTMAGFFDNESIGVLLIIATLYHFMKALRHDSVGQAIAAGVGLGFLMGSWGAYRFILDLLPLYAVILVLTGNYSTRLLKAYTITVSIGTILGTFVPRTGADIVLDFEGFVPLLGIFFLVLVGETKIVTQALPSVDFRRLVIKTGFAMAILGAITVTVLSLLQIVAFLPDKFLSVLIPTRRLELPLISSVSEHVPLSWGSLFFNIHALTFFIPLGIYYALRKPTEEYLFIAVYGVTSIYFTGSMVRLVLILAPAAALLSALAIDTLLYTYAEAWYDKFTSSLRKRKAFSSVIGKEHAFAAYLLVLIISSWVIGHSVATTRDLSAPEMTPGGAYHDWQETFVWLREHASSPDPMTGTMPVVLSWWDYGYWITNYGNATTLVDNATSNSTQIGIVGTMLMANATYAIRLMWKYHVKYVLINTQAGYTNLGGDLGKAIWMIRISEKYTPQFGIKEENFVDPMTYKYIDQFWDSVLYRLTAYDNGIPQPAGQWADASTHIVDDTALEWGTGQPLFIEVFRSIGGGAGNPATYRTQPFIRIYEVNYPANIEQLAAELDLETGQIS